jgi:putative nucleotidyltransferase with HDIG domain
MSDSRAQRLEQSFPALAQIQDPGRRAAVKAVWARMWSESAWAELRACPFNPAFPDVSLVDHVNCVAELALTAAEVMERFNPELKLDRDFLLTGALLHDVSKIVEIEPGPDGPRFSPLTRLMPHASYGAAAALAQGLPAEVANIILAHTRLTGALPASPEAVLLHYLDYGLADVLRSGRGLKLILDGGPSYGR